ncbi:MAG: carbohydrate-binding family 9-like protein, partial [Cyclobacteriaceae bacterium]|nr:carbohydrate-binding family 9-like protein [Cyclobacteriaceae bacterium]
MKYKIPSPAVLIIALFIFPACNDHHHKPDLPEFPVQVASIPLPTIPFQPEKYECLLASSEIVIDGKMEEEAWEKAQWTKTFTDIEGPSKPKPRFDTRVKMLWDSNYFYIAAQLEEPHVWGKLKQRDTILFHDNDFEVFIDPDGDTHQYYEIEINTLGTLFDLMLVKPYRDGGPAIISWDAPLMHSAVHIDGTLND